MKVVNLDIAKKLSRRKLQQGQTEKMYQKSCSCSVYELKANCKKAFCAYDAPNLIELIKIAEHLRLVSDLCLIEDVNEYAERLINLSRESKRTFEDVSI